MSLGIWFSTSDRTYLDHPADASAAGGRRELDDGSVGALPDRYAALTRLGHMIRYRNELSATARDEAEVEANQFAAELLMPEAFLRRDLEQLQEVGDREIEHLAEKYDVSLQAMSIRLTALRYIR